MKNAFILSLFIVGLTIVSCVAPPPQSVLKTSNPGFKAELLFEVDGCKVYRFYDGARPLYFTKCKDSTTTSSVGWIESCGKNCTRFVDNKTAYPKTAK
jgi:hypothetical protein